MSHSWNVEITSDDDRHTDECDSRGHPTRCDHPRNDIGARYTKPDQHDFGREFGPGAECTLHCYEIEKQWVLVVPDATVERVAREQPLADRCVDPSVAIVTETKARGKQESDYQGHQDENGIELDACSNTIVRRMLETGNAHI